MKLNCPVCSVMLDLDDSLAKKLVRCPKCEQSFVVPNIAPPLVAPKPDMKIETPPDEYELGRTSAEVAADEAPAVDPSKLKFCPGCGAPWKKAALECAKCNYLPALGAQLKPKIKEKRDLRVNLDAVYFLLFIAAVGFGIYYLVEHWNAVRAQINSLWSMI
ncbi:MAG: hypothetical protein WCT04_16895 [Planctomycetota bacterium]